MLKFHSWTQGNPLDRTNNFYWGIPVRTRNIIQILTHNIVMHRRNYTVCC